MNKLMDEKQVAALMEVSVKALQGWRYRGCGPRYLKFGRLVRYRMADLEAFVVEALRTSTSDRGRPPVSQLRSGFTIQRVPEHERRLDRPSASPLPATPRPAPGSPTRRRHHVRTIRCRTRIVFVHQSVDGSQPRPTR